MYYVVMPKNDIRDNLATEQYLMNQKDFNEPLLLLYIEKPCIIVGRNQNTFEEINQTYVDEHDITVTRRLSGGGAVYQDLGNLCFSFVVNADDQQFGDFKAVVEPIVTALRKMGAASVEVSGRNDILVAGKKFSGNAMYTRNGKTFSHGTLSYDVDLDVLTNALNVPADKIASKGIKSVRSRVTNLSPYLNPQYQNLTTAEFRDELLKEIYGVTDLAAIKAHEYQLTANDQKEIDQIAAATYRNWNWVYGKNPQFSIQRWQHFDYGTIDARLLVENGRLTALTFFGDFFGPRDVHELAASLTGVIYDRGHLTTALEKINVSDYFTGITREQLINLLA